MTDLIDLYAQHCAHRNLRPTYIYHQRLGLNRLAKFFGPALCEADTDDLLAYLASRGLSPDARGVEIAHLRAFYGWAHKHGLIDCNPAAALVKPRRKVTLPRPMPTVDVQRALAEAPCEVAPILNLAVYAGLRRCEIAQLRAEDIGPQIIRVRESKGGGESVVPISPTLASILGRCPLPKVGWLFPGRSGEHLSFARVGQIANEYLHSIGIPHTLHQLRHAYGTAVYRQTRDLLLTQELMRHRSIASTVGYTLLESEAGANAVAALHW